MKCSRGQAESSSTNLIQPVNNFSKTEYKLQVPCYNYIRVKKLSDDSSGYIMTGNKPRGYRIKLK